MILRDYDYYISTIIDNSNQVNDWILIEEFKDNNNASML